MIIILTCSHNKFSSNKWYAKFIWLQIVWFSSENNTRDFIFHGCCRYFLKFANSDLTSHDQLENNYAGCDQFCLSNLPVSDTTDEIRHWFSAILVRRTDVAHSGWRVLSGIDPCASEVPTLAALPPLSPRHHSQGTTLREKPRSSLWDKYTISNQFPFSS